MQERSAQASSTWERSGAAAGLCLFVICAPEDEWFVDGHLLPALGVPPQHVLLSTRLPIGEVTLRELERGATGLITLAVLSPAFTRLPWAKFAGELAAVHSVETEHRGGLLVPALLEDAAVEPHLRRLAPLDFRDRLHWPRELERLRLRLEERVAARAAAAPAQAVAAPIQLAPRASAAQYAFHDPMLALRLLALHERDPVAAPRTGISTRALSNGALFWAVLIMGIGLARCAM